LIHVLVLAHANTRYEVVGFIKARDAKLVRYERQVGTRPKFYGIPAEDLIDMRLLPK